MNFRTLSDFFSVPSSVSRALSNLDTVEAMVFRVAIGDECLDSRGGVGPFDTHCALASTAEACFSKSVPAREFDAVQYHLLVAHQREWPRTWAVSMGAKTRLLATPLILR